MENVICYVEECKYNHAKGCSANEITVDTSASSMQASVPHDTACEKFTRR